jgi:hypothetical protein
MTTLKKSEILHRLVEYVGERGAVRPSDLEKFAKSLLGSETETEGDLRKLRYTLFQHDLLLADGGIPTLRAVIVKPDEELPPEYVIKEFTLSEFGAKIHGKKMPIPYAEMLDADSEITEKIVRAALSAIAALEEPKEHDPERAKALLKKILGEELYKGVRLSQYRSLYPIFLIDEIEMIFTQGVEPEADYFLIDGFFVVRDLASLGSAIEEYYADDGECEEEVSASTAGVPFVSVSTAAYTFCGHQRRF